MTLPASSTYVINGAGIHGLSTVYHLALSLKASGRGSGADILVLDKAGIAAGASGIASGDIGAITPDSFPVFDRFTDNCYVIADSNHGYKMLGVGKLVAEDICGYRSSLLQPFRFSRYAEGDLHPVSHSPFPWS